MEQRTGNRENRTGRRNQVKGNREKEIREGNQ